MSSSPSLPTLSDYVKENRVVLDWVIFQACTRPETEPPPHRVAEGTPCSKCGDTKRKYRSIGFFAEPQYAGVLCDKCMYVNYAERLEDAVLRLGKGPLSLLQQRAIDGHKYFMTSLSTFYEQTKIEIENNERVPVVYEGAEYCNENRAKVKREGVKMLWRVCCPTWVQVCSIPRK
jgi:hypothetical protein